MAGDTRNARTHMPGGAMKIPQVIRVVPVRTCCAEAPLVLATPQATRATSGASNAHSHITPRCASCGAPHRSTRMWSRSV